MCRKKVGKNGTMLFTEWSLNAFRVVWVCGWVGKAVTESTGCCDEHG